MAQSAVIGLGEERLEDAALWRRAHEELVRLAAIRAGLDLEEGRWLLRAERAGAHVRLGYGTRVAMAATERVWVEAARGKSMRELEELVSGHQPGSLPDDVPDLGAKRHVLRLEVSGEVLATFREAMAKVRREAGEPLDVDAAVLLLCRQALEGPREEGRPNRPRCSYPNAVTPAA